MCWNGRRERFHRFNRCCSSSTSLLLGISTFLVVSMFFNFMVSMFLNVTIPLFSSCSPTITIHGIFECIAYSMCFITFLWTLYSALISTSQSSLTNSAATESLSPRTATNTWVSEARTVCKKERPRGKQIPCNLCKLK